MKIDKDLLVIALIILVVSVIFRFSFNNSFAEGISYLFGFFFLMFSLLVRGKE